ncbi:MAG: FeoA family protein [Candidatus Bathycorpusculaceae bacterium]
MQFRHRGKKPEIKNKNETVSIISLNEGERGLVSHAVGGFGLLRRLAEMGLTPGTEVKILRKGLFSGPVEIEVRGVALALGHGVASKVFVKPLRKESDG